MKWLLLSTTTALNKVAPVKVKKQSHNKTSPWINPTIHDLKRSCRAAERKWRKTRLEVHHIIYKECMLIYNSSVHTARRAYFSKIISESKNNSRILFSTIDRLLNPAPSTDFLSHASTSKCEDFARFFNNKITTIRASIPKNPAHPFIQPQENWATMCNFNSISSTDLCEIVTQSKPSSCCLDPVPSPLFKRVFNNISNSVLKIINTSLETGICPEAFKTAVVKPLLKKPNLDPSVLSNYRPISNLPFLSKVLEKVVFYRNFLNEYFREISIRFQN